MQIWDLPRMLRPLQPTTMMRARSVRYENDFPSLGLLGGDRLEPSRSRRDIREFDRVPVGTRVLFWREQNETLAKHRCPMYSPESHITIVTLSLSLDTLHALNLGI